MKKLLYILASFALIACSDIVTDTDTMPEDAVEMTGVAPHLSRSVGIEVPELTDYVGRREFSDKDTAVFTNIKRTDGSINQFTYLNLEFLCNVTTSSGVTSVGWSRIPDKGTTVAHTDVSPDRIYWTDATNPHTFIGFCKPQQGVGEKAFDWDKSTIAEHDVYYGSLDDPTLTGEGNDTIDYRSQYDGEEETVSGNTKLCKDDILLTYSTQIKAEDAIARLRFHHGLAQVRVIVNISDFAAGGGADTSSVVSDMRLRQMLTMYKWNQTDSTTTQLVETDNTALASIYKTNVPAYNQKKDVMLWIPQPKGKGQGSNRTFTFYGLAVPTQIIEGDPLVFSFKVTYPDPMNPTKMVDKVYQSSIYGIRFSSGKCTTINISLNHRNEKMTVGAEYDDWDFVDSPDQGSLKKNSTFLASTDRGTGAVDNGVVDGITILGDAGATADDATWLYYNGSKIVDVYGNDGTKEKPFTISTAKQLLSFAHEVKGTDRKNVTQKDTINGGWNFVGKYVKLDADIHLQSVVSVDSITVNKKYNTNLLEWIGIGDDTHAFNGFFDGGGRHITHLYGKAFFSNVGGWATISELNLSDVVRVTDHGALAEQSSGFIYACRVEGDVENSSSDYVGSLCGSNTGTIFACIHNGMVKGTKSGAKVGGLLGRNGSDSEKGSIAVSYHTGAIQGTYTYGDVEKLYDGSTIYACYYNSTLAHPTGTVDGEHVQGRTLGQMQSRSFANELNDAISDIVNSADHKGILNPEMTDVQKEFFLSVIQKYQFVFTPGAYPRVVKK